MLRLALRLTLLLLCALLPGRAWAAVDAPSEIRVTGEAAEKRVKGLEVQGVYCTERATLATPRLHLGNEPALRGKASGPLFRWKGRWWTDFGGPDGTYDMRARVWAPELGIFLSADAFAYHDARGTLWSWPNQNPVNLSDPSGNRGDSNAVRDSVMGGGLLSFVPSFKLFAVGTQMRADGISMMANEATFEEGDAKRRCGSNIIGLSMGVAGNDAAVLAGIAGMIPGLVRSAEVVAEAAAEAGERAALAARAAEAEAREALVAHDAMRADLGLKAGEGTLARLEAGGQEFWGINAHGQPVAPLRVNAISATHAEADAFAQAGRAGVRGGGATLTVDRALCPACGTFGAVRSMARQLGFDYVKVVTPGGTTIITP